MYQHENVINETKIIWKTKRKLSRDKDQIWNTGTHVQINKSKRSNSDSTKFWEHGHGAPLSFLLFSRNIRRVAEVEKGTENYDTLNKSVFMVQMDTTHDFMMTTIKLL